MSDFLTVKEFAVKAEVSVQAIYQRLERDLKPYLKTFKGKKYISSEGLQLFVKCDSTNVKQELNKDTLIPFNESANNSEIELLRETLTAFKDQLQVKDKQLAEKDNQIEQLTASLQAAQEQQTALTTALTQQQALHAGDIQRQLTEQRAEDQTQPKEPASTPEPEQKELAEDPPSQKLSFFQRLFRKRSE